MSTISVHRRRLALGPPQRQQGATLVIALLILVLIMMIGVTAISTSDTQFKLAGNLQFEDSAMNNAETAISTGESWLGANHLNAGFAAPVVATPYLLPLVSPRPAARDTAPLTMAWTNADSLSVAGTNQRYIVEQMSLNSKLAGSSQVIGGRVSAACNQVNTYLVTARGGSARGATKLVQTYYGVLNC